MPLPFPPFRHAFGTAPAAVGARVLILAGLGGALGAVLFAVPRLDPGADRALAAAHGVTMTFLTVIPALTLGFGNLLLPALLGARRMAFPRSNALAAWLPGLGLAILAAGFRAPSPGPLLTALALGGASALLGAMGTIATVLAMRHPSLPLWRAPPFVVGQLATATLLLISLPVLAGMLFAAGPDWMDAPRLLAWPETYAVLPAALGLALHVAPRMATSLSSRGIQGVAGAAIFSCLAWSHASLTGVGFTVAGLAIAAAAGLAAWTLARGGSRCAPGLWAAGLAALLAIGATTEIGALLGGAADATRRSAQLHYAVSLAGVFAIFGGLYGVLTPLTGRRAPRVAAQLHFWGFFLGANMSFLPPLALSGSPVARAASTVGGLLSVASLVPFAWAMLRARRLDRDIGERLPIWEERPLLPPIGDRACHPPSP